MMIDARYTAVAMMRPCSIIRLHCLQGPIKNIVLDIEQMLPKVYRIANFTGAKINIVDCTTGRVRISQLPNHPTVLGTLPRT
jgi:hypothetical protein